MGCSGSKMEDLPLVVRCRERRDLIRAAGNHRYALAAAHVSYFRSLKDVGDALWRFVDDELVTTSNSSISSPSLILPWASKVRNKNGDESRRLDENDDDEEESHLCISDCSSNNDGDLECGYRYRHYGEPYMDLERDSNMYYARKSAPVMKRVVQESPFVNGYLDSYWYSRAGYGGDFAMDTAVRMGNSLEKEAPPPPLPPETSAWEFLNLFDGGYAGYYSIGKYGNRSNSASSDWSEVREREGIPDLEEDTENDVYKMALKGKISGESNPGCRAVPLHKNIESSSRSVPLHKSEGSSKSVSLHKNESSSRSVVSWSSEEREKPSTPLPFNVESVKSSSLWIDKSRKGYMTGSISVTGEKCSPETLVSKSVEVACEVEQTPHGTRDLREVVAEIKDDFEIASSYGKEVAMMLEVGQLPYQPGFLKVVLSRMLYLIAPSLKFRDSSSMQSVKLASRSTKLAKSYFQDIGKDVNAKACNLSSTLDKLYAWEKKLYKEVKDEERLRVIYEKHCKRLKILDEEGAKSGKIYAAQASIAKLLTKLDVSIRAIDVISSRIHKLRDEELQPKVAALIQGLIRMWKAMLKCHQKPFQAIMESKMQKVKVNTGLQADLKFRVTTELEKDLRAWCHHFNDWVGYQKSFVEFLNGWLLQFLQYEPEETVDGPLPYSPSQLGAPPVFIICNHWHQAMEGIAKGRVTNAMNAFATSLQQLVKKQDEEERQRLKVEHLSKDYEKLLRARHMQRVKMQHEQDALSDKTGLSVVPSDTGESPLDDLKLNLDSLRQRLAEERIKHKDAMKLVHSAASSSLQGGLVPILKALENFTSEALKAHEQVNVRQLRLVEGATVENGSVSLGKSDNTQQTQSLMISV